MRRRRPRQQAGRPDPYFSTRDYSAHNKGAQPFAKVSHCDAIARDLSSYLTMHRIGGWRARNLSHSSKFNATHWCEYVSLQTTYAALVRPGDRTATGGFGDWYPTTAFIADLGRRKVQQERCLMSVASPIRG